MYIASVELLISDFETIANYVVCADVTRNNVFAVILEKVKTEPCREKTFLQSIRPGPKKPVCLDIEASYRLKLFIMYSYVVGWDRSFRLLLGPPGLN